MNGKDLHCWIPACSARGLAAAWLRGGKGDDGFLKFKNRRTFLTHKARTGIALACRLLGLSPGDEVLAPAYNCGTEIDALRGYGLNVNLYRVDLQARIDVADIRRKATVKTRALYVTHYWGWPQDLTQLTPWCRQQNLFLIEDCALSLFIFGEGGSNALAGDAAVFSFPKSLAVPDGGALVIKGDYCTSNVVLKKPNAFDIFKKTLPLIKSHALGMAERVGVYPLAKKMLAKRMPRKEASETPCDFPDMPASYYFTDDDVDRAASRTTRGLLRRVDGEFIFTQRRANYEFLSEALSNASGIAPLFGKLPSRVCPLAYPLLVTDPRSWSNELEARGICATAWWSGYHRDLPWKEFPEACHLKNRVLALPVHQDLDQRHMNYIAETVKELGRETQPSTAPSPLTAVNAVIS